MPPPVDADVEAGRPSGALLVAAGGAHTCALGEDRTLACWGSNTFGELGLPGGDRSQPTQIEGLPAVRALAAGGAGGDGTSGHTCAVAESGAVFCWGANDFGQLGDGTRAGRYTPAPVVGVDQAIGVSAGRSHTCALRSDGAVFCWGRGDSGALGNGALQDQLTPVQVAMTDPASRIAAGFDHVCALLTDSSVACWGRNAYGEVGTGDRVAALVPVAVAGLPAVASIGAGGTDSCAIATEGGGLWCWGDDEYAQLGDGGALSFSTRPISVAQAGPVSEIDLGGAHGCALVASAVACWGSNAVGQAGLGPQSMVPSPEGVTIAVQIVDLEVGASTSFAIAAGGAIWGWGANDNGELGDGTLIGRNRPVVVDSLP